ncbi:hypothetical protein, partial [Poseidonibacter sp.]|uniref:hypothetical protein n=1 Tax=Poseidonibacter sp. TaxID=2321188 RepID=UPI003C7707C4
KILEKYNMKIDITSYVVFLPNVKITNKTLPKRFCRADTFTEYIVNEFQRSPLKMLSTAAKMVINKIPTIKYMENIGNILKNEHKPVLIDYDKKYKTKEIPINVNLNKFNNIQKSQKYMGHEMLSFICKNCNTLQRKGLNTFDNKEVFCKSCGK